MSNDKQLKEYIKCASDPVYFVNTYGYAFNIELGIIARIRCFDYQEEYINNLKNFQNNIVLKSRQCIPEDTCVDTPNGPKLIQNFKKGDVVYSYNFKENKVEEDLIKDIWYSGEKKCVKFKLQDTRNFETGENHPFFVVNENKWVRAKELKRGDEILDINLKFGNISKNEDEVKLLAYLLTDGCTLKRVKFTNINPYYLDEFATSAINLFPDLKIVKHKKGKGYDYYISQKHGTSQKSPAMKWCEKYGIANKHSTEKYLPNEVFNWNKKSLSILINRMFAGDGWISIMKKGKTNKRIELGLCSPSRFFLEQMRMILKKFEIKSNIYEVKNMKSQKNAFFKLRITHSKSTLRFIDEIGIYKKINSNHIEISKNREHNVKENSIIKAIKYTDVKKCYDISVNKNENYLLNGLLTHNTGVSVITAAFIAWLLIFSQDERILVVADNHMGAVRFLNHVKVFLDNLPKFLLPDGKLVDNTKEIKFSNGCWVKAVASSKNAGRGETLTMLVLDETAFIEHADDIWKGSGLALTASGGKCTMISTPMGVGGLYHKTWVAAEKNQGDFKPFRIHWSQHPVFSKDIEEKVDENGNKYLTSPWYVYECERMHHDKIKIAQELDLSFEGSGSAVIDSKIIEQYSKRCINIKPMFYYDYTQEKDRFVNTETTFHIWQMPVEDGNYILGADVGRGDGSDYSTIQIIDANNLIQVAEYQGKIAPDEFANVIYKVAKDYNDAYVAVECNSFGLATTLVLKNNLKYKESRLHHSKSVVKLYNRTNDFFADKDEIIPGFQTTTKTRPILISALIKHMNGLQIKINSNRLLNEFKTFIYKGDKAEHQKGYHDDLIFAMAIALLMRDTEIDNVFFNKKIVKAMLDGISTNVTKWPDMNNPEKDDEDITNPKWLYGPILG